MSNSTIGKEEIPFGTIIDNRYIIQKILGQGGLGRTYLAFDTHRFNEPCVLKEFAPLGSGQYDLEKSRDLFKREAKILHQISHPQIPKFLACFEGQGRLFLVQEYVKGKTFSALLKQRQQQSLTFSEIEVIEWLMNLLPVLHYIHQRGIIHRDISPDNIMQPDGEELPVLIDFGVGKLTNASYLGEEIAASSVSHNSFVGKMSFVGKIGYAPREQISMGRCSPSSDLYSLGVTAIVLLTGREPTLLLDQYSLEWQWRNYARVGQYLGQILDKMIEDRPVQRYQTAQDIFHHLQQLTQKQRISFKNSFSSGINEEVEEKVPFLDSNENTIIMSSSSIPSQSKTSLFGESNFRESIEEEVASGNSSIFQPQQPTPSSSLSNPIEETMIVNSTNSSVPKSSSSIPSSQSKQQRKQSDSMPAVYSSGAYRNPHTSVNTEFIKQCQKELAFCIGPMASLIIEEILEQYSPLSPQELVDVLSAQIPDAKKALEFKRRLLS